MKAVVGARVRPEVREALERAAARETRTLGSLIDHVLTTYARQHLGVPDPTRPSGNGGETKAA